jgi:superfamily II DNA or RNA helicase
MIQLRDYQEDIIRDVVARLKADGYTAPLVVAPTGSGKTIMFAHIATGAEAKGKRVMILVHRREILQQTMEKLFAFGVQAGQIASGQPMTPELVQVAMVSTLVRRLESIPPPDLIIIDEAHHAVAGSWKKVQDRFPDVLRIGFTATPERLSGEGLIEVFDTMVLGPSSKWMVDNGHLSLPRMFCGPNVQAKPKMKVKMGDYDKKEQTKKMKERLIVGSVIQHYIQHLNGLPTVCFCVSIDHCEFMESEFQAAGFRARTVHGSMTKADRDAAIGGLATGEVQVLCSCDVISEGVDVPVIAGAILLRRTKSLGLYLQQVGRALRPYPGKDHAIILDHAGCIHEHGHVLDPRNWTLAAKKRSQREKEEMPQPVITVCPGCSGVWPGMPRVCPDCGYDLQAARDAAEGRKPPKEIAGILTEALPADTTKEELDALVAQTMRIQRMEPAARQKAMISNLHKYGADARTKGMAAALGYNKHWTETVYKRITGRTA